MRRKSGNIATGTLVSIVLAGSAPIGFDFPASAASRASVGAKLHNARAGSRTRKPIERSSRLGLAALGVTGSYGYGDDYPSYGSRAYDNDRQSLRATSHPILQEGRAAAIEDSGGYPSFDAGDAYFSPGGTYGRQTPNYGPGITYAAPVSPYRWAYSSENFPGTEFMGGR